MRISAKLIVPIIVLQIAYGLAVFALTRAYYKGTAETPAAAQSMAGDASLSPPNLNPSDTLGSLQPFSTSPAQGSASLAHLTNQADDAFEKQQYAQAASLYAQALALSPKDAELYNEVGIALHYAGRSAEAVDKLKQGVAISPGHQRIWLTLGFVQARSGAAAEGRSALQKAAEMDPNSPIGQEAKRLLSQLK
jgi:tetratricopeptide (TPR) repeat protein